MNRIFLLLLLLCFQFCRAQISDWQWVTKAGGALEDGNGGYQIVAQPIVSDHHGNIYVAGSFRSASITLGNSSFSNKSLPTYADFFLVKYDSLGNILWAKTAGTSYDDEATCIAVDSNDDVYLTGVYSGPSLTFDNVTITSLGGGGGFLTKFSSAGTVLWATSIGESNYDRFNTVAIDANGYIYAGGCFGSSVLTVGNTTFTKAGGWGTKDALIVKYSTAGAPMWATSFAGIGSEAVTSMDIDENNNLTFAGSFTSNSTSIGSQLLINTGTGFPTAITAVIAQYSPNGNFNWATTIGSAEHASLNKLLCGTGGDIYLSGVFTGNAFTIGTISLPGKTLGTVPFIVKYNAQNGVQWASACTGSDSIFDGSLSLALDPGGNIYQTGIFESASISFGTTVLNRIGQLDGFITAYSPSGSLINVLHNSTSAGGMFTGGGITISPSGKLFLTGAFTDSLKLTTPAIPSAGASDMFLAMYGPSCMTVPVQAASISGPDTVCTGSTVAYAVAPVPDAASYLWSLPSGWTGVSNSPILTAVANVQGTGILSVTASNNCGTGVPQTKIIVVEALPTPVLTLSGLLLNTPSGQGGYQWYCNDTLIAGASANTCTVSKNGSYYVVVTSNAGCSDTSNVINVTSVGINDLVQTTSSILYNGNRRFTVSGLNDFPVSLTVYNVNGTVVYRSIATSGSAQMDVQLPTTLASGIYVFSIKQRSKVLHQRLLVE